MPNPLPPPDASTTAPQPPSRYERLLQKAVDARESRPWDFYRFERDDLKSWLDKVADERDELRSALADLSRAHEALKAENERLKMEATR